MIEGNAVWHGIMAGVKGVFVNLTFMDSNANVGRWEDEFALNQISKNLGYVDPVR